MWLCMERSLFMKVLFITFLGKFSKTQKFKLLGYNMVLHRYTPQYEHNCHLLSSYNVQLCICRCYFSQWLYTNNFSQWLYTNNTMHDTYEKFILLNLSIYRIQPNKSRAYINTWAQINPGVQCSKANKRLCKMQKGLV